MTHLLAPLAAADPSEVGVVGDLVIVLVASAAAALLMRRLGLAVIPAFLVAGMVLGPHALGLVPAPDQLGPIAHLAVVILLFGIGLELHLSSLKGSVLQLLASAVLACLICVLAGWALSMGFGLDGPRALLVAMALSLSSTAVVLKMYAARRELTRPSGRLAVAILVVQDLAVVAMLAVVPFLAREAGIEMEDGGAFQDGFDVLLRLAAVAAFVILSRYALTPLLRETLRGGQTELLLLVGMAYALGAAWGTYALGFSLEMGAFLAGFVLSGTSFRHELAGQVVPVRDFFLAVFFTTLGMQLDPAVVADEWITVLTATAVLLVTKSVLISVVCWLFGTHASVSAVVGLSLGQAGEFSLVLLGQAATVGLLAPQDSAILIGVVVLSLLVTPTLASGGRALAHVLVNVPLVPWAKRTPLARRYEEGDEGGDTGPFVVIAGFGPVGRRVAFDLEEADLEYTVIELNPATVNSLHEQGIEAVLGDVRTDAVLREAGLENARAFVITVPDDQATQRACALARRIQPDLIITARAGLERAVGPLRAAGADHVVVDELAAADRMADTVVAKLCDTDAKA
ncbi:MAG: cation:proton antiporter [Planctomycetota bacterium]|nr:cation:proton antiporter [Planctomycetota bacterium]